MILYRTTPCGCEHKAGAAPVNITYSYRCGSAWLNNANKAYLPASEVANKSAQFFGFDWDGTTVIEEVEGENGEVKTIYDLTGRKIENPARGIYIVNGNKVVIK